ncbi:M57 family metalloprotease [Mucilaginibacter lappiensis]|uniref:Dual-action HEIGH metallo-peptidase n=1 Tax=Mucilaginibacter lappiensis TaxID=354630 RepID=A0A841JIH8_9SPHI|nr:M57 family metalloprotease [Mucilaginibacter lappiensis]MBB6130747.1 hypothetical protein [Mucilaginibacter lappiensis]
MKKVSTKKVSYFLAALGAASLMTITGCKKNESAVNVPTSKSTPATGKLSINDVANDLKKIKSLGFDPLSAEIIPGGYRVEGDIVLTKKNLDESFTALQTQQGQYSTKNPLSLVRTINVAIYDPSKTDKFNAAFDATVVDLNNLKIPLKFVKVTDTTKADIVVKFVDLGGPTKQGTTLGQDGAFIDSKGNPGRDIAMSTNQAAGFVKAGQAYITSVLDHEFGHAIGLRHTDYKNRFFSTLRSKGYTPDAAGEQLYLKDEIDNYYGTGTWDNQTAAGKNYIKQTLFGAGDYVEPDDAGAKFPNSLATHIYGTPLTPVYGSNTVSDPLSIMLAVTSPEHGNLVYSPYDNIAFFGIYGNPAQTALIRQSLTENGDLSATAKAAGTTLTQVVDAAKKLNSY